MLNSSSSEEDIYIAGDDAAPVVARHRRHRVGCIADRPSPSRGAPAAGCAGPVLRGGDSAPDGFTERPRVSKKGEAHNSVRKLVHAVRMDQYRRGELVFDVIDEGPADGPVVVLLHGFPQFNTSWSTVIPRLTARGYRCVAPNQRGYSPGARPTRRRDYRTTELVGDVEALIDALGADRVHLVGHDWGAALAWALAEELPERIATLTALSVPHPVHSSKGL